MPVTRIKNNQVTDASGANTQLGINANTKLQNYSITSGKLANNLVYGSDLTVTGNLTVQGNTTTIDTTITTIEDPVIVLASTQTSGAPAVDIGYLGYRGNQSNIAFVWDESADEFVTVFTSTGETNTTVTITSYADFHTNNANIGGNIVINGNASVVGNITGTVNFTGNISAGNLLTTGQVSATGNVTGGNVNTAGAVSATGNVTGGNVTTAGAVSATGAITSAANVTGGNLLTGGLISSTGTITGGNLATAGTVSATGTVTGGNLATGGTVSATGNVTGGNVLTAGLVSATGTITSAANVTGANITTAGLITATGNIVGGNLATSGSGGTISGSGNIIGGNILTGGVVSAAGNITAGSGSFFIGNGSQLTGVAAISANFPVSNGTSNINAAVNANITVGVSGTSNVAVFATTGLFVTGVSSTSGNVIGGNLTTAGLITATGNITGGNLLTPGLISAAGLATSGNVQTAGFVSAGGNVIADNVVTDNVISSGALTISTGANGAINIQPNGTGNIILGGNTYINGVSLNPVQDNDVASKYYVDILASTALTYHEAVVAATTGNLATATGGTITYNQPNGASNGVGATLTTTGSFNLIDSANVQTVGTRILVKNEANAAHNGVYVWSNATVITRSTDADQYGAADAEAISINDYFFVSGGNVNLGSAWVVDQPAGVITFGTSNIVFAQFSQAQIYSANTSAGLQLVGQTFSAKVDNNTTAFDGGGNISVKAGANLTTPNIGAATGTSFSATGNIQGGNILTGGFVTATGNVTGGNVTTAGVVSATGNVTGGNILFGSGVVTGTGNVVGGNLLTGGLISATGTITSAANITGSNLLTGGLVSATGNVTGGNVATAGVVTATGNVTGGNLLTGGSISATGTITSAATITGGNIATGGTVSATGNVTGGNVLTGGLVSATGTITSAANITGGNVLTGGLISSTGAVTSGGFTTTGNVTGGNILFGSGIVSGTGNVYASNFIGNISGNIDAGGANTEIQFNDSDTLAGNPGFTFNKVGNVVTANGNITGANLFTGGGVSATANITGANLILTTGTIDGPASGRITINGSDIDTDFAVDGDTLANIFYVDAGTSTASFGSSTQVTNAIVNFSTTNSIKVPVGNTAQRPGTGVTGMVRFNTSNNNLELFDNSAWTAVGVPVFTVIADEQFNGDGSTVAFTLGSTQTTNSCIVSINGVVQIPTSAYSVAGTNPTCVLTFTEAPAAGDLIDVRQITTTTTVTSISNSSGNAVVAVSPTAALVNVTGDLSVTGSILGGNINSTAITNGNSNVTVVSSGGNVTTSVGGTANVMVVSSTDVTITGNLTVTGNATLTGNILGDRIQNGTTIIDIQNTGGNANITVGGTANVAQFTPTSVIVGANILPTANITYDIGSTSQRFKDIWLANSTIYLGNAQLSANATALILTNPAGGTTVLAGTGGNVTGGNITTGGLVSATGNVTGGNILTAGIMSSTGNGIHGNVLTAGVVSATGNITGNFILGNGSQLTGIDATSIQSGTSNVRVVSSGGNVAVGIGGTSNVVVVATTGQFVTGVNSVSGNITGGNVLTGGLISATGNITGGNILGGANVNATTHTGATVSVTGNVDAGNLRTAGLISATGAITTAGDISITGNIVDAAALTISTGSNGNITLAPNGTGVVVVNTDIRNGQANATGNIGATAARFNTVFALATSAQYADLAEKYAADATYEPGTVVMFGGSAEVTLCVNDACSRVAGVISTNPSYRMNDGLVSEHTAMVALTGRVPTKVTGTVRKGDLMVSAGNGTARAEANPRVGTVIGKALADSEGDAVIEVVVGRV